MDRGKTYHDDFEVQAPFEAVPTSEHGMIFSQRLAIRFWNSA